ncbi:MAG: AAA family ATPase [Rickettsiales bacterium]|jgi:DNA replication and repair protein RecF|nr:AAA family ATPase [Rickettsiales bacterium]
MRSNFISRLALSNFRSYERVSAEVDGAKTIVITGANGAGKTNILESISMLSPGGPLRKASLAQLGRIGGNPAVWTVYARAGERDVGVSYAYGNVVGEDEEGGRRVQIDGEAGELSALARAFKCVWLTPLMDRLFTEAGGERRRFLDSLIANFYPFYGEQISQYNSILKARARVLKSSHPDMTWAGAHEAEIAALGVSIAAMRLEFEEKLNAILAVSEDGFPALVISVSGTVEDALRHGSAVAAEERFLKLLYDGREDFKRQAAPATPGVHRSDFSAHNLSKQIDCAQSSTGEQKIAVASVLLAYAKMIHLYFSEWPLIIIDEAPAHLDESRRAQLFAALEALPSQVWLSGTSEADFEYFRGKSVRFVCVENSNLA